MLRSDLQAQENRREMNRLQKNRLGSQTLVHQEYWVLEKAQKASPPLQQRQTLPYLHGIFLRCELIKRKKKKKKKLKEGLVF